MRKVENGLGSVGPDQGDNVRLQDLALTMHLACWTLRDFEPAERDLINRLQNGGFPT